MTRTWWYKVFPPGTSFLSEVITVLCAFEFQVVIRLPPSFVIIGGWQSRSLAPKVFSVSYRWGIWDSGREINFVSFPQGGHCSTELWLHKRWKIIWRWDLVQSQEDPERLLLQNKRPWEGLLFLHKRASGKQQKAEISVGFYLWLKDRQSDRRKALTTFTQEFWSGDRERRGWIVM